MMWSLFWCKSLTYLFNSGSSVRTFDTDSLCEKPRRSSLKYSVTDLRYLIIIWDVILFLWLYTHTEFIRVSSDFPGYDSSIKIMSYHICTCHRLLPVRHWVTIDFLNSFLCVIKVGETLYARCMQPLSCVSSRYFLMNLKRVILKL